MPLASGARLGCYEILSPLGVGGMGEVYRAHDTKLNRDVAIKVLLPAVANDPEIRSRLEKVGLIARGSTSGDYAQYIDEQLQHWGQVARFQKIEPAN